MHLVEVVMPGDEPGQHPRVRRVHVTGYHRQPHARERPHAEAPEHRDMGVSPAHQDEVLDHGDGLRVHRAARASTRDIARSKRAGSGNRLTIRNASRGKSKK